MVRKYQIDTSKTSNHFNQNHFIGRTYRKGEDKMIQMIGSAKTEIIKLEKMMKKIDEFLKSAPEGCLKWQNRRGKTYYYQQYMKREEAENENKQEKEDLVFDAEVEKRNVGIKKWKRKYITNNNIALAKELAKKHYYIDLKNIIQKRLKALNKFVTDYPFKEIEAIYDDLCDERKVLIDPIEITVKEKVKQWMEEVYEKNVSFSENLRYETEQGDIVRSKSEVIIANILYQHRKDILYKYEKPLEIIENGRKKTIYPDFTIINVHTGDVTYWEHAGIMDDAFYANEFVRKMNVYIANGLLPGKDVLLSFETKENALDIKLVKKMVINLL